MKELVVGCCWEVFRILGLMVFDQFLGSIVRACHGTQLL